MTRDDLWIFAKTIWAEARGEPLEGQIAVANVILNRARQGGWWGDDVAGVCCKSKQFSCWNEGDPNRARMDGLELQDRAFARAVSVAAGAWAGVTWPRHHRGRLPLPHGGYRAVMGGWA